MSGTSAPASRQLIPFTGELVKCYGCSREVEDRKGCWNRTGTLMLCGPSCPGTTAPDAGVFAYFRTWVRLRTPVF